MMWPGAAPTMNALTSPASKSATVGIDDTRSADATSCIRSTSSFANRTDAAHFSDSASITGETCRHGAHQSA